MPITSFTTSNSTISYADNSASVGYITDINVTSNSASVGYITDINVTSSTYIPYSRSSLKDIVEYWYCGDSISFAPNGMDDIRRDMEPAFPIEEFLGI